MPLPARSQERLQEGPPGGPAVPPLVLLPGMMCDARLFEHQIALFSAERAVQVGCLTAADTVDELAGQVLASAPATFALAGLSMGGIVAMEVVRRAPGRVAALALLDTNPMPEPDDVAAVRAAQVGRVRDGRLVEVMRDELKPNYLADGPRRAEVLDLCMKMARSLGAEVFERQARALTSRPDQRETLRAVAVPTLVLTGESDALCPRERHTLMHSLIADSTLVVIPGAGHLPTLERPEASAQAMRDWLRRI